MRVEYEVTHEAPWYVARWVGHDIATQGATAAEAVTNLKDAVTTVLKSGEPVFRPAPTAAPMAHKVVRRTDLVRRLTARGWRSDGVVGEHELFVQPGRPGAVAIPAVAQEVAYGVYRVVARAAGLDDQPSTADLLAQVDAIFALHPEAAGATEAIRAERDAV